MPSITVRVSDETIDELDELAQAMDRSRSWVVTDALQRYLESERDWLAAVERGRADVRAGRLNPHDDVMKDLRAKISSDRS